MPPKVPKCLVRIGLCHCKKEKKTHRKDLTAPARDSFQLLRLLFKQMALVHYPQQVVVPAVVNSSTSFIFLKTKTKHQSATVMTSMPFSNKDHQLFNSLLLHSSLVLFLPSVPCAFATRITVGIAEGKLFHQTVSISDGF